MPHREDKIYVAKHSFSKELRHALDHFLKYHVRILLGDFSGRVGRVNIFKLIRVLNES